MTSIMGYCDPWSVAPGETVRFMVSATGAGHHDARLVRLKQPDAGPDGTPFEPEPVPSGLDGRHPAMEQRLVAGSWGLVRPHPSFASLQSFTLQITIFPTTPDRGRQALIGTWSEREQAGFGLMLDECGCLDVVLGRWRRGRTIVERAAHAQTALVPRCDELRRQERSPRPLAGTSGDHGFRHRPFRASLRLRRKSASPATSRHPLLMAACNAGHDGPTRS